MKAGTLIFLIVLTPVVTLVSYGYMLADYSRLHSEVQETTQAYQTLERDSEKQGEELKSCLITVQDQKHSLAQREAELALARSDNNQKANSIAALESHVAQLQSASVSTGVRLDPWLVGVIVIAQVIVTLTGRYLTPGRREHSERGEYIRLSPEERDLILQLRRRKSR